MVTMLKVVRKMHDLNSCLSRFMRWRLVTNRLWVNYTCDCLGSPKSGGETKVFEITQKCQVMAEIDIEIPKRKSFTI